MWWWWGGGGICGGGGGGGCQGRGFPWSLLPGGPRQKERRQNKEKEGTMEQLVKWLWMCRCVHLLTSLSLQVNYPCLLSPTVPASPLRDRRLQGSGCSIAEQHSLDTHRDLESSVTKPAHQIHLRLSFLYNSYQPQLQHSSASLVSQMRGRYYRDNFVNLKKKRWIMCY